MPDFLLQRCETQLKEYLVKLAATTKSSNCHLNKEQKRSNHLIRPVSCGRFKSEIWIPKSADKMKRCSIEMKAVKKMVERHETKQEPSEFLGWEPIDIDKTCKPIITPEIEELRQCLIDNMDTAGCENEGTKATESLVARGIPKIGVGSFRNVFGLSDKCVMKIPKKMSGALQNRTEQDTWERIKDSRNKKAIHLFAPVISVGEVGEYLVMARARRPSLQDVKGKNWEMWLEKVNEATEQIRQISFCEDLHSNNFGMIGKGNRVVLYDYGFGLGCIPRGNR